MGHVQLILDIKNQPEKYSVPLPARPTSAGNVDVEELKRLINVWGQEINILNAQIERYRNRLSSRRLSSEGRKWMREIIRVYQSSIAEYELKRSSAMVKLNLYR
jgi:hypothetical protein